MTELKCPNELDGSKHEIWYVENNGLRFYDCRFCGHRVTSADIIKHNAKETP